MTFISDSAGGALTWASTARESLSRGLDLDLEVAPCRKLTVPGCAYQGERPPSALELIRTRGKGLGRVVVIMVGYNDLVTDYVEGIDDIVRALAARGVERVVWVTLRETRSAYAEMNNAVVRAAAGAPVLVVADWSEASAGHPNWFSDEVHLTVEGGDAFARFLRPIVLDACGTACAPGGDLLAVTTAKVRGGVGRPLVEQLLAEGGTPPYRWTVTGLPRPLHLSRGGKLTGKPRASGRFPVALSIADASGITNRATVVLRIAPRG